MLKIPYTRAGFMLSAFLLPGLIGTFATYAIPVPVEDELHQAQALEALPANPSPAQLTALADQVDPDTAALVVNAPGLPAARAALAEQNMRQEVLVQAREQAVRIRLMVVTMTMLGAVFGVFLLGPEKK